MQAANSLRPVVVAPGSTQEMLERLTADRLTAASLQAGQGSLTPNISQLGQGFTAFAVPGNLYPELTLFSQIGQLFGPQSYAELTNLPKQTPQQPALPDDKQAAASRGKTRSSDSRNSSAYASRHQAAEQRRRTRINERLELLRKMVPHAERANTACFLEEVIKYIDVLKKRNAELESAFQEIKGGKVPSSIPMSMPQPEADKGLDYSKVENPNPAMSQTAQVNPMVSPNFSLSLLQANQPQAKKTFLTLDDSLLALTRDLQHHRPAEGAGPNNPPPHVTGAPLQYR